MSMILKFSLKENGDELEVFTFTREPEGHLDVQATESEETLLAALDKVQEMIDYVRSELE